ncbi:AAA family ATPase [Luethyella okanaganae]|uniref:CpaE family protein n=1 Tax=Luethyella okanaganae TaxID=69372 RepID=A0ABW1VE96_9MICO
MAVVALALDREVEDRLLGDIVEYGNSIVARVSSARELLAAVEAFTPSVALVGAARSVLNAELIAVCDARGVRVIALASSDLERRHAASLGLYEVLEATADWPEIQAMIDAGVPVPLRLGQGPLSSSPDRGSVVAVWGPAGAPGRTTLAITIAAEIAAIGYGVVLADADTYSGSAAPALGMLDEAPGFAAACRLAASDSLTRAELERVAQRYESPRGAFWVLTGLGRPSRWPELGAERVTRTIEACRDWVDYVVLDTGFNLERDEEISSDLFAPRRNAATLAALRDADHVVAVGLADPVGMSRFLRAYAELAAVITTDRVSVVMNRVRSSAIGLDAGGQVRSTLRRFGGIDDVLIVPDDQQGLDAALLSGRTLPDAAPKSPVGQSVRRFVRQELLSAPETRQGHRRGLLGRLGSARGLRWKRVDAQ